MTIDNPYAPPASDLGLGHWATSPGRRALGFWAIGFAANLIVPAFFARLVLTPLGWVGVVVAVLFLLMLGLLSLKACPAWNAPATTGAFLVATTQLFPMLQIIVGASAIGLACAITGDRTNLFEHDELGSTPPEAFGPATALLATALSGLTLMSLSLIVGLVARFVLNWWRGPAASVRVQGVL